MHTREINILNFANSFASNAEIQLDGTNIKRKNEHSLHVRFWRSKTNGNGKSESKIRAKIKAFFANLSQGLMVPIAVLPIAGLFLGIGSAISNNSADIYELKIFGDFLKNCGNFIFSNLQLLFVVSVALAYTNQSGVAGFSAAVGILVFNGVQNAFIKEEFITSPTGESISTGTYTLWFYTGLSASIFGTNAGIFSMQTSVFGAIVIGAFVAWTYNRFGKIKLPDMLGFFNGSRFVPIMTTFICIGLSVFFCLIWPMIGLLMVLFSQAMGKLIEFGNINSLIFGFVERSLIPLGVHHAFYTPLWYSAMGGDMYAVASSASNPAMVWYDGQAYFASVSDVLGAAGPNNFKTWWDIFGALGADTSQSSWQGDVNVWFSINSISGKQLDLFAADGTAFGKYAITFDTFSKSTFSNPSAILPTKGITGIIDPNFDFKNANNFKVAFPGVCPGQYLDGKFPFMIFGLPAAGAGMILAAPKENRKYASSIIVSAAATAFITGITEPFEFTFLFLSPLLFWGIHASFCALAFWSMSFAGAHIGMTFSGGMIDLIIYGIIPDVSGAHSNSYWAPILGLGFYAPAYFFVFNWYIKKFDLATPGRGTNVRLFTKKDYLEKKKETKSSKNNVGEDHEVSDMDIQAYNLIQAHGGLKNITNVNACITKLRVGIINRELVKPEKIVEYGSLGVSKGSSSTLMVSIFGTRAEPVKEAMLNLTGNYNNYLRVEKFILENKDNIDFSHSVENKDSKKPESSISDKEYDVYAPFDGRLVSLSETKDDVFENKMVGDGFAIIPDINVNKVCSPIDGKVEIAFPTGHAYVISNDEIQVMVHIGIETVNINTNKDPKDFKAFKAYVKAQDVVNKGDVLTDLDLNYLIENKFNTATPVVVLNENLTNKKVVLVAQLNANVKKGEIIFKVVNK